MINHITMRVIDQFDIHLDVMNRWDGVSAGSQEDHGNRVGAEQWVKWSNSRLTAEILADISRHQSRAVVPG
jgi:hypothetical protein